MRLTVLPADRLLWPIATFGSREPCFQVGCGAYKRNLGVDPRPAYTADQALVGQLLAECVEAFPLAGAAAAELVLLPHDFADGFNGITFEESVWKREDGSEWKETHRHRATGKDFETNGQAHTIVLAGKPIPHHPALLRYLVAHEYGHAVFNHLRRRLGYEERETKEAEADYAAARGLPAGPDTYSAGRWHLSTGEIIANDFRVLVMGREREFWPHAGVPLPTRDSAIGAWWERAFVACGLTPRFA